MEEYLVIILYQQPALEPLARLRCPSCMTMACLVASSCSTGFAYLRCTMYCTRLRLLACHEAVADRFPKFPTHIAVSVLYLVSNVSASLTSYNRVQFCLLRGETALLEPLRRR